MPPDEFYYNVNDSVYTNTVAKFRYLNLNIDIIVYINLWIPIVQKVFHSSVSSSLSNWPPSSSILHQRNGNKWPKTSKYLSTRNPSTILSMMATSKVHFLYLSDNEGKNAHCIVKDSSPLMDCLINIAPSNQKQPKCGTVFFPPQAIRLLNA